ncbi:recombinase family protein [Cohnella massiliensis]|uniref:recombinase family protein n=1 Tax=Cohnella massiliensis TaxID=1816691 RepID=UPI0009BABE60|nr:recombinase family protein [Cohnella massiliensis]
MSDRKTAVGYIRVSTDEQVREGYSLDNQIKEIEKKCEREEWELLKIFDDKGVSGALLEQRTGLKSMLKFIKERKVNYLVIYKMSRLSRKIFDIVNIAEFLEKNSTYLISVEDKIDTSNPMGKYFLVFSSIIADMERENIIVQVKGGMSQKARQGEWNGGEPPLGYDLVDKKLVINVEEAEIVKLIYSEYLKGSAYLAIAEMLNQRTIKTKKGKNFSGTSVKGILQNPTYTGKIRWGHRKDWGKRHEDNKRKRQYDDNPIISKGIHEAIIDEESFNKVQEMINSNPRRNMKRFDGKHLLSGLLRCPACGYGMSYQPATSKGKEYGYYICNQYMNLKTCKPNGVRKDLIEEEFLTIFEQIVNEPDFKAKMMSSLNNSDEQIKELERSVKRKESEISILKGKQDKLFDELTEGNEAYRSEVRIKIQENLDKIAAFQEEISATREEIRNLRGSRLDLDEIVELFENVGKVIRLLDKEAQQTLVRKLISSIKIENKHIAEVHFSFQQSFRIGGGTGNRITNSGKTKSRNCA